METDLPIVHVVLDVEPHVCASLLRTCGSQKTGAGFGGVGVDRYGACTYWEDPGCGSCHASQEQREGYGLMHCADREGVGDRWLGWFGDW
jgi:hypothetical protein